MILKLYRQMQHAGCAEQCGKEGSSLCGTRYRENVVWEFSMANI